MKKIAEELPGYDYDSANINHSTVSMSDLDKLKESAGFTAEDERFLRMAGTVLEDQTEQIVLHWRSGIIASIPNLARHSRSENGESLPDYLAKSNLRFRQWILDTCLRPYDQNWLNYQQEIALRHTSRKKNATDGVTSTDHVPYSDIVAFVAVLNETIRPYLAKKGHMENDIARMHAAWQKSLQMQMALWAKPYMEISRESDEW